MATIPELQLEQTAVDIARVYHGEDSLSSVFRWISQSRRMPDIQATITRRSDRILGKAPRRMEALVRRFTRLGGITP